MLQAYLPVFDFAVMGFSGLVAGCFAGYGYHPILPVLLASCVATKYLSATRSYELSNLSRRFQQAKVLVLAAVLWFTTGTVGSAALSPQDAPPSADFALATLVGLALLVVLRVGAGILLQAWWRAGRFQCKIAILGLNNVSVKLISRLRAHQSSVVTIAGLYQAPGDAPRVTHGGLIVKGTSSDLVEHSAIGMYDLIVITLPPAGEDAAPDLTRLVALTGCDIAIVGERELALMHKVHFEHLSDDLTVAVVVSEPPADQSVHKIVFDKCVALMLLVLVMPAFLVIAVAIRLDSKGPVFFWQPRCGYRNRTFRIVKFRTMYHHCNDLLAQSQTTRNDSRITRVGRWLRRASLDELPQLFNVLAGDMSLVGPRPHAHGTRAGHRHLREIVDTYLLRHKVKPGITGLAQINGCRGALQSDDQVVKRVAYDMFYIQNWSFLFDLKILFLTMFKGFSGTNTY